MESEKVKEIKKALEYNVLSEFMNRLPYADEFNKLKMVSFEDILTLINELENENAKLLDSVETVQNNRCTTKCELTKKALIQFGKKFELNIGKHLKKKYSDYQQDSFYYIVDKADVDMCLDKTLKECLCDKHQ